MNTHHLSLSLSIAQRLYQLPPPFKRLTEAEISRLSEQYRVEFEHQAELEMEEENERRRPHITLPPTMPVPIPIWYDTNNHPVRTHPPIDLSNPSLLVTPVLVLPGWDHDIGYDGLSAEGTLVNVKEKIHMSYSGQVTENFRKKGANVQLEMASLVVHGEEGNRSTSLGFEMQKKTWDELSCTLRSDSNFMKHKAAAGLAVTLLGDSVSAGMKAERKLIANKRFGMDVCGGGAMTCRGDAAYGGSLEAQLLGRFFLSTLGLSVVDGHGGLAIGGNIQTQVHIGRSSDLTARANLNSRGAVQVSIRANIFEQLEHAMAALVPLFKKLLTRFVLLVRNLDVLARVYTMKTEIMQIKEEFGIQNNCEVAISVSADDDQRQKDQRVQKNSRHESDGDKKDSVAERTKNVICTCLGSRYSFIVLMCENRPLQAINGLQEFRRESASHYVCSLVMWFRKFAMHFLEGFSSSDLNQRLFDNQVYGVVHGLLMGHRENLWPQAQSLFIKVKEMDG
ncbi:hypothetical protein F2Q68_00045122 [Brassica cretica]|uniref:Translocase of chloroplast 159/132 membrane anchor domain-containing protein n=1 Tax=Brassica cretica TaxID=69181 RepID=A0A8S9LL20_BRACR|nr:hypothetical protein F2Q68_00045122 [Brassica cretica]